MMVSSDVATNKLTAMDRLALRLSQFKGKAVTMTILVGLDGMPMNLIVHDERKVEMLSNGDVANILRYAERAE